MWQQLPFEFADIDQAGGLSPFGTMGQTGNANEFDENFDYYFNGLWGVPRPSISARLFSFGGVEGLRVVYIPEPTGYRLLLFLGYLPLVARWQDRHGHPGEVKP